jgi:type I restriction enzyme S subunit
MRNLVALAEIASSLPCHYGEECTDGVEGTPVAKVSNISSAGKFHRDFEYRSFSDRQLKGLLVQEGELLVVKSSGSKANILSGKTAYCDKSVAGELVASNFLIRLRVDQSKADSRYLWHVLNSDASKAFVRRVVGTTTYPNLKWSTYSAHPIPLPPLEEQRRIAAILDKTAELSGANRRRQDLLRAFPLSVYRQMFGDPRHNPFLWPVFQLGEICLNEDARRVPVKSSDRKAMQGRFPYYGASGVIDHVDDYLFDGQRLLVGEDGANLIARSSPIAFIANGKYWVNNHAHVLNENGKAKLRFLEYYFALVDLKPFVTGSAQPKLTRSALDSLPVPLPPLDLQERFESVLTALDARLAQAEISAQQTSSLSCALRSASFQGDAG